MTYLPGSAFRGDERINVAPSGLLAMEMHRLIALIVARGSLLAASHGGWKISGTTVLLVLNRWC
ncbi:hypothetical protein SMB59_002468 [Cronobacter muytjensii]|nr:hypothetical protein [Cronobacter muytjensii]